MPDGIRRDDWGCAHPDDLVRQIENLIAPDSGVEPTGKMVAALRDALGSAGYQVPAGAARLALTAALMVQAESVLLERSS